MTSRYALGESATKKEGCQIPKPVVAGSIPVARSDFKTNESNSDYHADKDYHSCSSIKDFLECPAYWHRRHVLGLDQFSSSSMERGTLVHTALELGKAESAERLRVPPSEYLTQTGLSTAKKAREFFAQEPDVLWVSPADGDFIGEMWRQIELNTAVQEIYDSLQHRECSIRWERDDGTKLKCRPDGITADGVCIDYKTCRFRNPLKEFWKNVRDYKYGLQSYLYSEGCLAAGFSDKPLIFILISTVAPYAVQAVRLPTDVIHQGRRQLDRALNDMQAHAVLQHDYLPLGYGEIHTLDVPKFVLKDEE